MKRPPPLQHVYVRCDDSMTVLCSIIFSAGVDLALIKKIDNPNVDIQQEPCIQALITMLRTDGDL